MRPPQYLSDLPRRRQGQRAQGGRHAARPLSGHRGQGEHPESSHAHHGHGQDGGGRGGAEWTRGRKVSADDLQLMLLSLLEQHPSHGYELIKALGNLSNGYYTPSPGMVYPALTYLEELGQATVEREGSKKRYHLAPDGLARLQAHREHVDLLLEKLRHIGRRMEWMRQAWSGEPRQIGPQGEDLATGWVQEYVDAHKALRHALLKTSSASPAEQRRVAEILRQAVQAITDPACP